MLLIVHVVQEPGHAPQLYVFAEVTGVLDHGRLHGVRVTPEALGLGPGMKEIQGFLVAGHGGLLEDVDKL